MRRNLLKPAVCVLAFGLAGRVALCCSQLYIPLGSCLSDHPVCVALRLENPETRIRETRQAIHDHLLSRDPAVRQFTWNLLSGISNHVDLYPYLDLIETYGEGLQRPDTVGPTADLVELRFAPRSRRLQLLGNAVRFGNDTLPRGTSFPRMFAVRFAALQGLEELQPAVARYLAALEPERIRKRGLASVPALFELCAGAEALLDAPRVAFARILAFEERRLDERFVSEGFRDAFFELADIAARTVPSGSREPESLRLLQAIAARQLEYRMQSVRSSDVAPSDPRFLAPTDWLKQLRRILGLEKGCIWW